MEDYHAVVVQGKLLSVMLRRAVSCVKHLNHIGYSKCDMSHNYTRKFINKKPFQCWIACGKNTRDVLPPKMTAQCKRVFSCAKLAKQRKCSWKFKGSLNQNCRKNLPYGQQNAIVKNYCRKSCQNCDGKFSIPKEM